MSDDETERKELAAEILRTVPMPRLMSAVSAFLRDWHRHATGDPDVRSWSTATRSASESS